MYSCTKMRQRQGECKVKSLRKKQKKESDERTHYFASPKNYVANFDDKDMERPAGKLYISNK